VSLPKIVIKLNALGHGTIEVDGVMLNGVQGVKVNAIAGQTARVFLRVVGDVEVEVEPSIINAEILGIPATIVQGKPRP
jgi:hypothetical protein